jgi:hypothetical protein
VSLRGLEMLLALTGCLLFFGVVTGNLQLLDVVWAFGGIATVLAITSGVMVTLFPYLKETRRWERFIERVGHRLMLHSRGGVHRPSISGGVGDCQVAISPVGREQLIIVSVPSSLSHLEHYEMTLEARTEENRDQPSMTVGDPEFDEAVLLRGNMPETIAVLDARTRAMILELMRELSVEVRRRHVMKYGRHLELDPDGTWLSLQRMAELAHRLFTLAPKQAKKKLADNAEDDPRPRVRALNLRLLFEYYPPDERTLLIGRRALESEHVELVVAGAVGLAEAGDEQDRQRAFRHLAGIAQVSTFSDDVRSDAIEELPVLFPDRARPILRSIANEASPLPAALIPAMVKAGLEPPLDRFARRALVADEPTQIEIIRRLPREPRFEQFTTALLDSPFDAVQLGVAAYLADVGTIRSVEHLLPLTKGVLRSKALRERAQRAIDAIQARAGNGDGGQLSLADRARGELSLHATAGELSIRED